mmetsp:Transcript_25003/g.81656  ORF Transcript_25003/g.81656 Transcript_25003/m.81656 type:complete len:248 (-) Transcript_25003:1121-1864(-)
MRCRPSEAHPPARLRSHEATPRSGGASPPPPGAPPSSPSSRSCAAGSPPGSRARRTSSASPAVASPPSPPSLTTRRVFLTAAPSGESVTSSRAARTAPPSSASRASQTASTPPQRRRRRRPRRRRSRRRRRRCARAAKQLRILFADLALMSSLRTTRHTIEVRGGGGRKVRKDSGDAHILEEHVQREQRVLVLVRRYALGAAPVPVAGANGCGLNGGRGGCCAAATALDRPRHQRRPMFAREARVPH